MVRALCADESATRRLSLISAEVELPDLVKDAIAGRPLHDERSSWGIFVGTAWAIWVGLGLVDVAVVFGFAMAGARDVQAIAQWWTALVGWALVGALVLTTVWCAASRKWMPALVWAGMTIVAAGLVVVTSMAFLW